MERDVVQSHVQLYLKPHKAEPGAFNPQMKTVPFVDPMVRVRGCEGRGNLETRKQLLLSRREYRARDVCGDGATEKLKLWRVPSQSVL